MRWALAGRMWHGMIGALVAVAVLTQLGLSIAGANVLIPGVPPPPGIRIWQFFSYFTIQANILVVLGSISLAADPDCGSEGRRIVRFAGLLGITVTGLVYATLLRPLLDLDGLLWWLDLILHTVSPLLVIVGWVAWGPRPRLSTRVIGWVLLWPVVWLAYTLVVGALRGWYPYPFLNPSTSGWTLVIASCMGITALFVILSAAFAWVDRRWPTERGA